MTAVRPSSDHTLKIVCAGNSTSAYTVIISNNKHVSKNPIVGCI